MRGRPRCSWSMLGVCALALIFVAACGGRPGGGTAFRSRRRLAIAHANEPAVIVREMLLGRSVLGHPIAATEIQPRGARRRILVVGCIHGNEPAGIAIAELLENETLSGLDVWTVDDLNPDGVARNTRQNADGVDLNRNFPFRWQPLGRLGDQQYSGAAALSEPESRAAYDLIRRIHPSITVWFHQPLALVDESGGNPAIEQRYASLVGLPLRRLIRYPGSAAGWQNNALPGTTAFVVELPAGALSAADAERYADGLVSLS
jgi:protein MpaA